jgi:hypothetical protein
MTAKYSLASNSTAGDRFLWVGQDSIQLSTGDWVGLVTDPSQPNPSKVSLVLATGATRATETTIAILNASTAAGASFLLNHALPQCLALCKDGDDNLYVFGANGAATGKLMTYQAFIKQSGLVWQPGVANVCTNPISAYIPPVGYVALWCNTGGGSRYPAITGAQAGHIIVAATTNDGSVNNACFVLDAGTILNGGTQNGSNVIVNPAFMGDAPTLYGSNLDLSPDGFGSTSILTISANGTGQIQVQSCGVSSTGSLTTGIALASIETSATLTTTTKLRILRYAPGSWAAIWPSATNPGQLTVSSYPAAITVDTGIVGSFPAPSASLSWDASVDSSGTVWIYGWKTGTNTTMMRLPITFPGGVPTLGAGGVVQDDTSLGATNTTIRTVKEPVDWFHADWQGYALVSTTYSLIGDYSALPVQPFTPTLVSPLNGAPIPLATGETLDWNFTSPESTDAQVTYYLRRQNAAGYQWWTGSAFTAAQPGATGGSEVAVTSAATLATFGAGLWAAGVWSWSVQVTGASGVISGYSPAWTLTVVAQPATPTLTATYDSANNRVPLTVAGTGTDHAWFQYSDDGVSWFNVRGATSVAQVAGAATVYDYWAPPGAARSYRVAQFDPAGVAGNYSAWSSTQIATPSITTFWLRRTDIDDIGINPHVLAGTLDTSFGENMTEHQGLSDPATMIVGDVIGLEDGVATLFTYTAAEDAALMAYVLSQRTLLFQSPDNRSWFVRWNVPRPVNTPYVVRPGSYRDHALSWRGQSRPST